MHAGCTPLLAAEVNNVVKSINNNHIEGQGMIIKIHKYMALLAMLLVTAVGAVHAQDPGASASASAAPIAPINWQDGPRDVPLLDQAVLKLPKGYAYLDGDEARQMLRKMGNPSVDQVLGLISGSPGNWFVVVRFEKECYIKDDEAKDWKSDELFDSLKKGTEQSNEFRRKEGIPEIEIVDWVEKPHYDSATHRLVWSIASRDKGSNAATGSGINYNTYALGRDGYFSLNLVTSLADIGQHQSHATTLLSALEYKDGKRYGDFNSSTDKIAAYGLTALVAGVAAKKLGLIAVALAFAAKFAKLFILAAVGGLAMVRKLFTRKKAAPPASLPAAGEQSADGRPDGQL